MDWLETTRTTLLHTYASCIYYTLGGIIAFVLGLVILLYSVIILQTLIRISQAPPNIPWAGLGDKKLFPKLRACLREFSVGRKPIHEGYETYGKNGKPFIIPGLHWNAVVLPPSNTAWVAAQPEHVLSGNKVMSEALVTDYLTHGPSSASVVDFSVLRRDLTRQMGKLTSESVDEIENAFTSELGMVENEWKEFPAMKLLQKVSFRAANRMFVGLPLCRSETYEKDVMLWTSVYGICTLLFRYIIPEMLKPAFGRVLALLTHTMQWWASRSLRPRIRERLQHLQSKAQDFKIDSVPSYDKPNDMLQWIIDANASKPDPAELHPSNIAGKMILFNIFAFATTSTMSTIVLFDLLVHASTHPSLLTQLRDEAETYLPLAPHDPLAVRSMKKLDSAIRESLRYNPMAAQGMIREVVSANGIVTPDGLHLPRGTHVQSIISPMQKDPDIFGPGIDSYDPLRFYHHDHHETHVPVPDEHGDESDHNNNDEEQPAVPTTKQKSAVQISDSYISFGLGRHACPGRFFAVHTMKLMLGYLLVNYDIEPFVERPKYTEMGEAIVPSAKTTIKIRRRQRNGQTEAES